MHENSFTSLMLQTPYLWLKLAKERIKLARGRSCYEDEWLANAKNMHKGQRCFIIATGPSLNDLDLSLLKGEITFGVNGTYMLDNVDLTYFAYVSNWWHKDHIEGIRNVRCKRRFLPSEYREELDSATPTSWYRRVMPIPESKHGPSLPVPLCFSRHPSNYIMAGGTVVFVCLQLAFHMGFDEVIIIGLDHSYTQSSGKELPKESSYLKVEGEDKSHFASNYFKAGTRAHVNLQEMERGYELAEKAFRKEGRKIFNASAKTKLEIFPRIRYEDLF